MPVPELVDLVEVDVDKQRVELRDLRDDASPGRESVLGEIYVLDVSERVERILQVGDRYGHLTPPASVTPGEDRLSP